MFSRPNSSRADIHEESSEDSLLCSKPTIYLPMLQRRDAYQVVWPIDNIAPESFPLGGRLLNDVMDIIASGGSGNSLLQFLQRLGLIKVCRDVRLEFVRPDHTFHELADHPAITARPFSHFLDDAISFSAAVGTEF